MNARTGIWCLALVMGIGVSAGTTFRRPQERIVSLDPLRTASVTDSSAVSLVYEPLLEVDYFARPYKLKAGLCDLPEVSADGREYLFRIRPGARFTDDACFPQGRGRPVVAEDIAYSLNRIADKANASSGMWIMSGVEKVEALDAATVKITLKTRSHVFPWLMSLANTGAVPKEAVEFYGTKFGGVAVGSGPYRLEKWIRNQRMTFVRDASWRGWTEIKTTPYERVNYLFVEDLSTRWLMFLSGQVDFLQGISKDNWEAVMGEDGQLKPELAQRGIRLYSSATMTIYYIGMNMEDPVVGPNRKLRQALNCAFDFPAWSRFYNNRVMPAEGPVPPGVEGRLETPFAYSFNVEKAKRLIAEAGYPDGVDPKTGKRLVIEISVGRATQEAREQVELMQSFYSRIGIRLEPRYMTWDAYLKAVNEGRTMLFMLGWVGDYPDAETFLQLFISKNVSPGANHGNYRNAEVDRLYDQAMAATEPDERNAAWRRIQEIIREDCPWIFLHVPKVHSLAWDRVGNYLPSDYPYGAERHFYQKSETPSKKESR